MKNHQLVNAFEVFLTAQEQELPFKLKLLMARNQERLQTIYETYEKYRNVSNDDGMQKYAALRNAAVSAAQLTDAKQRFPGVAERLAEREKELQAWLKEEAEDLKIIKIPISLFPETTAVRIDRIFPYLDGVEEA